MPSFKDHQRRKLNRASLSFHSCVKKLCPSLQPCSTPCGSSFLHLSTWWFIFPESWMALMTRLEGLWGFILHLNILSAEARGVSTSFSVVERKGNKVLEPVPGEVSPCCWHSETLHWELKRCWLCTKQALDCESCKESRSSWDEEGKTFISWSPCSACTTFFYPAHVRYNSKCSCATADWMSWFRWNENRWVNSRLLLV